MIYEGRSFPHSVSNVIISKKAGSEFPKNKLNSLLNICWKQMIKDFVVTLGSPVLCQPLITLQTSIQWRQALLGGSVLPIPATIAASNFISVNYSHECFYLHLFLSEAHQHLVSFADYVNCCIIFNGICRLISLMSPLSISQ